MTVKEYLNQIKVYQLKIENKKVQLAHIRDMATSLKRLNYNEKVQTSRESGDSIGDDVADIIEIENEIKADIIAFERIKLEVISTIDTVHDIKCYNVLYQKYVNNKSFDDIAEEMGYTDIRQVLRLHGKGLNMVRGILGTKCH
jgi:hypothetical protein